MECGGGEGGVDGGLGGGSGGDGGGGCGGTQKPSQPGGFTCRAKLVYSPAAYRHEDN